MTARQVLTRSWRRSSNLMDHDQTGSVMSKEELRNRLLGTWQLVSSVIRFEDGEVRDQLGHEPSGFLIYTANGYACAELGARNRQAALSTVSKATHNRKIRKI